MESIGINVNFARNIIIKFREMNRIRVKFRILLFTTLLVLYGNGTFAQLKIKGPKGKVIIGLDRPDTSTRIDDIDDVLSASIFGRDTTEYRPGAKIGFGDFDSDRLWLHGKYGFK